MTAHGLIEDIFRRVQEGVAGDTRFVTADQLRYLRLLIGQDEEIGLKRGNEPGEEIWAPSGRWKYFITEDAGRGRRPHRLRRQWSFPESQAGRLF